jgi:hypothetical protein
MAEAKICDLCGEFYKPYKHAHKGRGNHIMFKLKVDIYKLDGLNNVSGSLDLCKECLNKELIKFIDDL